MSWPCDTSRTEPNAALIDLGDPLAVLGGDGSDVHRAPIMARFAVVLARHRTASRPLPSLRRSRLGAPEQVAQHPVGVLAERRPGLVVPARRVRQAKAVALVEARAEERVGVRLEVVAQRELRVVVQVAEVLDRHRFDAERLQLVGDLGARARRGPRRRAVPRSRLRAPCARRASRAPASSPRPIRRGERRPTAASDRHAIATHRSPTSPSSDAPERAVRAHAPRAGCRRGGG